MAKADEHGATEPVGAGDDWRQHDDATLVAGMRNGWEPAYAEFFGRYVRMLTALARRGGIRPEDQSALVTEFLDDVAMRFGSSSLPAPRSLGGYLAAGFRARLAQEARGERRRQARVAGLSTDIGSGSELAVAEALSAYSIALTEGPEAREGSTGGGGSTRGAGARSRLIATLMNGASDSERKMLGLMAQRMPQREIAELLGVSAGAVRVRILRLRERLWHEAVNYVNTVPVEEGLALQRVLAGRAVPRARHDAPPAPTGGDNQGRTP